MTPTLTATMLPAVECPNAALCSAGGLFSPEGKEDVVQYNRWHTSVAAVVVVGGWVVGWWWVVVAVVVEAVDD